MNLALITLKVVNKNEGAGIIWKSGVLSGLGSSWYLGQANVPAGTRYVIVTATVSGATGGDATSDLAMQLRWFHPTATLTTGGTGLNTGVQFFTVDAIQSVAAGTVTPAAGPNWSIVLNEAAPVDRTESALFWLSTSLGGAGGQGGTDIVPLTSGKVSIRLQASGTAYAATGFVEIESIRFVGWIL